MIKTAFALVIVLACSLVRAGSACGDINGLQSYPPLVMKGGIVCFVMQPVFDRGGVSVGADEIALYFISEGRKPTRAEGRGLLYDEVPGQIVDAFVFDLGNANRDSLIVIQSMEIRGSLVEASSSGEFYSVAVFDQVGAVLRRNERASGWFGDGYSKLVSENGSIYEFPYKSQKLIRQARSSAFASLMLSEGSIPVRVKIKSRLYDGPSVRDETRKYLVSGDNVTVDRATAGWCRVNYSGGRRPLQMWLMCSALEVGGAS